MFCTYTRARYQVSVYRTIGPLVIHFYAIVSLATFIFKYLLGAQNFKNINSSSYEFSLFHGTVTLDCSFVHGVIFTQLHGRETSLLSRCFLLIF